MIKDEPIATVERDRQQQEARTKADIGRTKVVPSSQRQRWVLREQNVTFVVSEIMHIKNARINFNVGVEIISNEIAHI